MESAYPKWNRGIPPGETRMSTLAERMAGVGTHLRVWPASSCFVDWAETSDGAKSLGWTGVDGLRLLELGSGQGWLGMRVAANMRGASLTLTDLAHAVPDLRAAVDAEVAAGYFAGRSQAVPRVDELDWSRLKGLCLDRIRPGAAGSLAAAIEDILPGGSTAHCVFGCDLAWNEPTCDALTLALSVFVAAGKLQTPSAGPAAGPLHHGPQVVYAHWNRANRTTEYLLRALRRSGVALRLMHPAGWVPQPGSYLEELLLMPPTATGPEAYGPVGVSECSTPVVSSDYGEDSEESNMAEIFGDMGDLPYSQPSFFVFAAVAITP